VTGIAALLTLIYVGSSTAFEDVISLTITGFYGSYLLPSALLLYHRIKGNVLPKGSHPRETKSTVDAVVETDKLGTESPEPTAAAPARRADLIWGPWHIPGILGILNNIYACAYMIFVIFWSVWPPSTPVDATSMNYSVVVTGGVMILSAIWYYIGGKKQYTGPTIDEEVKGIMGFGPVGDADADGEGKV
jgi:amino acid transporter